MVKIKVDMGGGKRKFEPSQYQQAIFDWIVNGNGSAIIEAVAGSGKTTTIVQALDLISVEERAIFLAFNRSIAEELKNRVPAHTTAATFHSAGWRLWRRRYPRCQLDDRKVWKLTREFIRTAISYGFEDSSFPEETATVIAQLVGLAKMRGIGCLHPNIPESWQHIIDHHDIQVNGYSEDQPHVPVERIIEYAQKILATSTEMADTFADFGDMIYMPVLRKLGGHEYDWVFIDEAQDTNEVRRELASMLLRGGGRLVAVGDSHQAIYGFTGADSDAMDLISRRFDCDILPLSICYRSAKNIVAEAQTLVPEIEANESSPDGIVKWTTFGETPPGDSDVILCRNTAPLVNLAYELISQGRGCKILGRDIGKGLISLIKRMSAVDINDLIGRLETYRSKEVDKLRKQDKDSKAQAIEDKIDSIITVINHLPENNRTIDTLNAELDQMFQENDSRKLLTLSTVHKAKGLEWGRVYLYAPKLIPSKWARKPWQVRQETNLKYVAITRAKHELYYVEGDTDGR